MMIARRIIAVILGIVFIVAFLVSAFIMRANETALNEDFYVQELHRAKAFDYFYSDVLPALIDQVTADQTLDPRVNLDKVKPQLIAAIRDALPPDWLEQQAEAAIRQFAPYVMGDTDHFTVHVDVAPRIQVAAAAAKKLLNESGAIDLVYDNVVTPAARDTLADPKAVPFGIPLTPDDAVRRIRRAASDGWVRDQLAKAIDATVPYVQGQADRFKVTIGVSERVEAARAELKDLGARWDARKYLFDNVIDPAVRQNVNNLPVPFGLTVTAGDVQAVLRDTLTEDWVRARVNDLIDSTVDYVSGKANTFSLTVALQERKAVAVASVGRLTDAKLTVLFNNTRLCTAQELQTLRPQDFARTGIPCRPPGVTLDQLKSLTGLINYQGEVARLVDSVLPNTFRFVESDLRGTLDNQQWDLLQNVRGWVRDGVSFTDMDLEDALARMDYPSSAAFDKLDLASRERARDQSDNVKSLREARQHVKDGGTFTQEDLKKRMEDNSPGSYQDLQDARGGIASARGYRLLLWVLPIVLLVGVALLGARSIAGKVLWAATVLAVCSLILVLNAGPLYNSSYRDQVQQGVRDSLEENIGNVKPAERAIRLKAESVILDASDQFASGLARKGVLFLVVSAVAAGGAIGYGVWRGWRGAAEGGSS